MKHYEDMYDQNKVPQHTTKGIMNRDFIFAFFALFTFVFGVHALYPTLPIYLARLGSNAREIGVNVGIFGISSLFS